MKPVPLTCLLALLASCDAELALLVTPPVAPVQVVAPAVLANALEASRLATVLPDRIAEGVVVEQIHTVKNLTQTEARLGSVTASCDCTRVSVVVVTVDGERRPAESGEVLEPGERLEIRRAFDSAGRSGRSSSLVNVVFDEPRQRFGFELELEVEPALSVSIEGVGETRELDLGTRFRGIPQSFEFSVSGPQMKELELSGDLGPETELELLGDPSSPSDWIVRGRWSPKGKSSRERLEISLVARAHAASTFGGERTSLPIALGVRGEFQPRLEPALPYVSLGCLAASERSEHQVRIDWRDTSLEASEVELSLEGATNSPEANVVSLVRRGDEGTLTVRLEAPSESGRFRAHVVGTTQRGERLFELPLFGEVAE